MPTSNNNKDKSLDWYHSLIDHQNAVDSVNCLNDLLNGEEEIQPILNCINSSLQDSFKRLEMVFLKEFHRLHDIIDTEAERRSGQRRR